MDSHSSRIRLLPGKSLSASEGNNPIMSCSSTESASNSDQAETRVKIMLLKPSKARPLMGKLSTLRGRIFLALYFLTFLWLFCMNLMIGNSFPCNLLPGIIPPPPSIPLPLPKQKASVILMNFNRPYNIRESSLMRTLLEHPSVDEVLLLHGNPKTAFEYVHPKVVNIDATVSNDEMGLSLRFYYCQLAKNDWIIHVDDDMEFYPSTIDKLLLEFNKNTKRIVGRYGRDLRIGNFFNGYSSKSTHKSSEVILTKLMVMERDLCGSFFEHAYLVWDDLILSSGEGPLWNGEDIFMSLVANHVYGNKGNQAVNYAMDWLPVWEASERLKDYSDGIFDISGGMKGYKLWDWTWWQSLEKRNRHYSFRGMFWQAAKERLLRTQ